MGIIFTSEDARTKRVHKIDPFLFFYILREIDFSIPEESFYMFCVFVYIIYIYFNNISFCVTIQVPFMQTLLSAITFYLSLWMMVQTSCEMSQCAHISCSAHDRWRKPSTQHHCGLRSLYISTFLCQSSANSSWPTFKCQARGLIVRSLKHGRPPE